MQTETGSGEKPQVFHVLSGEALSVRRSPTGAVGTLFSEAGVEMVWVAKQNEAIDPEWFTQRTVDLLVILQGELRVEFEQAAVDPLVLTPGDVLVLPANTRCRAYRWPRHRQEATIFLAVYPPESGAEGGHQAHSAGAAPS